MPLALCYNNRVETPTPIWTKILFALAITGALSAAGYAGYTGYENYRTLKQAKISLEQELEKTKREAVSMSEKFASTTAELTTNIEDLKQLLSATNVDRTNALQDLLHQQEVLDAMSKTLGVYEKIVTTDKELLVKYSRVYFLSENYSPRHSVTIPPSYTQEPLTEKLYLAEAWPFLKQMLDDAAAQNVDLKILSAYRSFDTQNKLKNTYTVTYGTSANKFSADQGYSEHQLGTAIDFTTGALGTKFSTFEKTTSYVWLTENAYKYGFVISYPKKNAYYIFEPWHWRFVGKALALKLHNENKNFVDLSQRELNEFLSTLFDSTPEVTK